MVVQRARTAGGIPASHDFFVDCGEFGEVVVPQSMTIEEAVALYELWRSPLELEPTSYWSQAELDDVVDVLGIDAHDLHIAGGVQ